VKPRIPPPILMLLAAGVMWALNLWLPLAHWIPGPWNLVGAAVPAAIGFVIAVAAFVRFHQVHTTVNPVDPSKATQLVTDGVFRFSRNPMYLGLVLLLIGWAVWIDSASPWIIPPLFMIVITRVQIMPEEQALERLFGAQYVAYRRSVARWIGRSTRGGVGGEPDGGR
jgi:protein-S-isoprenylcysteine O-methyltransferase Ste14